VDNRHVGRLATEHLLGLGHRRIGIIIGPLERDVVASRLHGYRAAHEGAEVNIDASLEEAMGSLSALHQARRRVPEEVAVVGCDDLPLVAHTIPPLTTVPPAAPGVRQICGAAPSRSHRQTARRGGAGLCAAARAVNRPNIVWR